MKLQALDFLIIPLLALLGGLEGHYLGIAFGHPASVAARAAFSVCIVLAAAVTGAGGMKLWLKYVVERRAV
jgi:hypothetical protein